MAPAPAAGGPNDGDPPTGELCGSVFWAFLNKRLLNLDPDNETFAGEIERSIVNIGLGALGRPGAGGQGPNGTGIRYFANMHKSKQNPSMHASCCEGQGSRLFGSLPQFVYTLRGPTDAATAAQVDVYTASALTFPYSGVGGTPVAGGVLVTDTTWPYGDAVTLTLRLPAAASTLTLALRMPAWLPRAVTVTVNGAPWPTPGTPGSYLHVSPPGGWPAGQSTLTFNLPAAWTPAPYTGFSQLRPYTRAAFLRGPVLMAFEGPWDAGSDSLVLPAGLDIDRPDDWLVPAGDGHPLHWAVAGGGGFSVKPYFEVDAAGERLSAFPCFH